MVVHDYGPGRVMITLHAEVSADDDIMEIHDVIDRIEAELFIKTNALATIHMDPIAINDEHVNSFKTKVTEVLREIDPIISFHDFRIVEGSTHTNVIFDVLIPFNYKMTDIELRKLIREKINQADPTCFAVIQIDKDYIAHK